jgi:tetratricopeptide (TPR) repeat protein
VNRTHRQTSLLFLLTLLWLAGCATAPTGGTLPPVEDRAAGSPPPVLAPAPGTAAYPLGSGEGAQPIPLGQPVPPPIQPSAGPAAASPAVVALMQTAAVQRHEGQLDQAAASLERALRIEPDNALLWGHLAELRLAQERWIQAEQLALKSNRLSSGDRTLQARNWETIADARSAMGDDRGSQQAREQSRRLRTSP